MTFYKVLTEQYQPKIVYAHGVDNEWMVMEQNRTNVLFAHILQKMGSIAQTAVRLTADPPSCKFESQLSQYIS